MKRIIQYKTLAFLFVGLFLATSCGKDYLDAGTRGTDLESDYYQTPEEMFTALVAVYDVLQWGGTNGWTMKVGLVTAASDEAYAGGSNASDQPSWVAYDDFTLDPELGPQSGLWAKGFTGVFRANLYLEKLAENTQVTPEFRARTTAEVKFLRAFYYFDLVRFFGRVPLILEVLTQDNIYTQKQAEVADIYAQIEKDLREAKDAFELPATLPADELGRITSGAVTALLGKVILYQNDASRMNEAALLFEEVINSGIYNLEPNFGDIFKTSNEFGTESVFEIVHSPNARGGWGNFGNGTEGNYNTQFFGFRDYVGPDYAFGYGFCPVTESLFELMENDPRFEDTIIDGNELMQQGASYTPSFQSTNYRIRKYAGLVDDRALDGEAALNWGYNIREIRLADVLLMAAEAHNRAGNDTEGRGYLNQVRQRVGLQPVSGSGAALLDLIYLERQKELATEGHRFFDLLRTGRAAEVLADQGFTANKNELLPIPQSEIDITEGLLEQNQGY